MRFAPFLLALPVLLIGCTRAENRWSPGATGNGVVVLVAPVAAPDLIQAWPAAPTALAHTAATRVDLFGKGLDGFAGEGLPTADDAVWKSPVAQAKGAAVVVLVTLDAPKRITIGPMARIEVTGTLRVADAVTGQVEFTRAVRGSAEDVVQAKLMGPSHTPHAEACTSAAADAAGQAIDYLTHRPDRPVAPATVALTLASTPANADVLVDGQLKGTTPCTLQVPTGKAVVLRLERQGHRPWERTLTPSEPLSLSPALEPGN